MELNKVIGIYRYLCIAKNSVSKYHFQIDHTISRINMQYEGVLKKMQTEIGHPIQYYMLFESDFLKHVSLKYPLREIGLCAQN